MTSFSPPQRLEPPRQRVLITQVDTVALTAVGSNLSNRGKINIDISIHSGQTVIYPRENEEWLVTKVNETWILDKKAAFGNEGLLREANPGDLVTVTTGDYYLDSGSNEFVADSTFDGHLTANSDFSVWGNSDLGPLQIYGRLDLLGDIHMNGYKIYTEGGFIETNGGHIRTNGGSLDAQGGQIWGGQIVGSQNSFFDKNLQANSMHCINTLTTAQQQIYGHEYHHGYSTDMQGGDIACRHLGAYGGNIWAQGTVTADNYLGSPNVWSGAAHMSGDGFGIGNAWMTRDGHFTPGGGVDVNGCFGNFASFGGMGFSNGYGIETWGRQVNAGFGWMWAGAFITNISEARFKRDIAPIEESQLDTVLAAPLYNFRYNSETINDAIGVTPQVTEASEIEAPAQGSATSVRGAGVPENQVITEEIAEAWQFGPMADDLPDHLVGETSIGKGPNLGAMVNTLWGAVQELNGKLDEANEKIANLTTRLAAVGG